MPEQVGVENLKRLVKFGCDVTKQLSDSLSDGYQWTDLLSLVDELSQIPGVVQSLPQVKAELADLSPAERTELHGYLVQEFDIPNDDVEAFIENALSFVLSALALVEQWKALKTPEAPPAPDAPIQ